MAKLPLGDIGPCALIWGYGESGALRLDPYLGTVSIKGTDTTKDVQEEEWGDTPVDSVFGGTVMEIEAPISRSSWEVLEAILSGTLESADRLVFGPKSGCAMYENAHPLGIIPLCDGTVAGSGILIYKTYPIRKFDLSFDRGTQRVILTGFKVFKNEDSAYPIDKFGEFATLSL